MRRPIALNVPLSREEDKHLLPPRSLQSGVGRVRVRVTTAHTNAWAVQDWAACYWGYDLGTSVSGYYDIGEDASIQAGGMD